MKKKLQKKLIKYYFIIMISFKFFIVLDSAFCFHDMKEIYFKKFSTIINYDITNNKRSTTNYNQLGVLFGENLPLLGPESFSNDIDGNLFICDTVNKKINVYSCEGIFKFHIQLNNIIPNDIAVDKYGRIYIYDDNKMKIFHIAHSSEVLESIEVNKSRWDCRSSIHIVNNNIYLSNCSQQDIIIGKIVNGKLVNITNEDLNEIPIQGILSASDKRYIVRIIKGKQGIIYVYSNDLEYIYKLPIKGILSIKYISEDQDQNFYIQTEKRNGNSIELQVHKFDYQGILLCSTIIPQNNYTFWSIKLLSIDNKGNIWQFITLKEEAIINCFKKTVK